MPASVAPVAEPTLMEQMESTTSGRTPRPPKAAIAS